MDMVNLKKSAGSKIEEFQESAYPYNTKIKIEDEHIDALKADGLIVGDKVLVVALADVTAVSDRTTESGRRDKEVELQLTDMKVKRQSEDRAKRMYGDN